MSRLRRCCVRLALACACTTPPGVVLASADVEGDGLVSLTLPGPGAGLAAAAGLPADTPPARLLPHALRVLHGAPPGRDAAVERAMARVDAWLSGASSGARTDRVPSPLAADAWRALAEALDITETDPVAAVLRHRALALTYLGLLEAPPATRALLTGRPALLATIAREHAGTFAAFGCRVQVADGRVVLPGGAGDAPLWESLVGARASDPARFVEALLERHDGRLALFFDTVARLDEPRRRFALAANEGIRDARQEHVRRLLRLFIDRRAEWRVNDEPFRRPLIDESRVLAEVSVTDGGVLRGPPSRRFWRAVLEGGGIARGSGRQTDPPRPDGNADQPPDAAWIVGAVLTPDLTLARLRLGAVCFVQRVFGDPEPALWATAARAGRGFLEAPALSLVLERLDLQDLRLFARAADRAVAVGRSGESAAASVALAQLQGGLALVDRLRFRRVIAADEATRLVSSLVDLDLRDGRYSGAVVSWIEEQLLPAVGARATEESASEARLLEALAGEQQGGPARPSASRVVRWEESAYRVDPAAAEASRLQGVLARQRGARLGDVLGFARAVRGLLGGREPGLSTTSVGLIDGAAARLRTVPFPGFGDAYEPVAVQTLVAAPLGRLAEIVRSTRDRAEAARVARTLLPVIDAAAADALAALAYAVHLGDPDGPVWLAPGVARRHAFGLAGRAASGVTLPPWDLPAEEEGQGRTWRVRGALLGLEVALADLSLRSVHGEALPPGPRLAQPARHLLELGLALMNPSALEDATRDAIVAAVERGRRLAAAAGGCQDQVRLLARRAGWATSREALALWECRETSAAAPPEAALSDSFWTGLDEAAAPGAFDAWGLARPTPFAALRSIWPSRHGSAAVPGPATDGPAAREAADLTLRVALALAEHDLPSALAPAILALALFDVIHEAPVAHEDDGLGLALQATRLGDDRLADYVSALTAGGPLVPLDAGGTEMR